ncbi:hypothetical protein H8356DRAFT_928032 [Neocallimastix lanati (nom. inval.)]|uniref:Uncharacterized protein n=1 Tax=Neocallimastix californiae TaxID=1754190 RepID=A0A1Y2EPR5_9FUNG|nr:hypothetical protein H8356DRAFT_928032 [Neocallimastix sp. JGI-2020a]ORY73507.1 hypothetical protein LY90DRAFT_503045 [Neocallimastix californiae]|eukprot:ORY73507.1 hypothetical protein LY90DRAFT_503045 [Neocallimastix californiae]
MSLTLSTAILKNSILQKTSINIINNHIIKNRCLYSTENGPKIEIPNLQTKDLINNSENKNTDTDKPTPKLFDDKKPLSDEPLNKTIDNSETKSSTEKKSGTIPITKKENKKSSSSGNNYNKYYLYATLGLFQLIPLYYFFKKRRTLNDYNSSDVKRVKRVQKSVK